MKKTIFGICLLFLFYQSFSQAPNFCQAWSLLNGGQVFSSYVDINQHYYVAGDFNANSLIGSDSLIQKNTDAFVAKYDSSGNALWARSIGGRYHQQANAVVADNWGNVYLSGQAAGDTILVGAISIVNTGPGGGPEGFLTKYDSSGNVLWVRMVTGRFTDVITSMTLDSLENIIITGYFNSDTVHFNTTQYLTKDQYLNYRPDAFIASYDTAGNLNWVKGIRGTINDQPRSVRYTKQGFIYLNIISDSDSLIAGSNLALNPGALSKIYTMKYDLSGNLLWLKGDGGNTANVISNAMATDDNGDIYVTGEFYDGAAIFGNDTIADNPGNNTSFLVKYDASANFLWVRHSTGASINPQSVIIDKNNDVLISGGFSGTTSLGGLNLNAIAGLDIFVAKYDQSGNEIWVKSAGGLKYEVCWSLMVNGTNDIYICGDFREDTINFDGSVVYAASNGNMTGFVAKICNAPTGISEPVTHYTLTIFPIPSKGNFDIICSAKISEFKITNCLGQELYQVNPDQKKVTINLTDKGIYFFTFKVDNTIFTKKVIVNY